MSTIPKPNGPNVDIGERFLSSCFLHFRRDLAASHTIMEYD